MAAFGLVASLLIARGWQTTVSRQRDERLDRTATSRTAAISGVLGTYENALQAARSLWLASDSVDRAEFSSFARSLNLSERYPGLQGIAVAAKMIEMAASTASTPSTWPSSWSAGRDPSP